MSLSYTVRLSKRARRSLDSTSGKTQERLISALEELRHDPYRGSSKLKGKLKALYRKRVGDYRIVIQIHAKPRIVLVLSISNRRETYRKR